jgi:hypothetical protein
MNIVTPGTIHQLTVILRETTVTDYQYYLVEFMFPGGKVRYGKVEDLTFPDADKPALLQISHITSIYPVTNTRLQLNEKDQCNVSVYTISQTTSYPGLVTKLTALENSPVGDSMVSLKQALDSIAVTSQLVYRGLVYCTAETVYYPYNPIKDEFETIEKPATIYKSR